MPSRRPPATRRAVVAGALLVGALALSACTTFTDNNAAARVGDTSLGHDELDELIVGATPGASVDERVTAPATTVQNLLSTWILAELLRAELSAAGRPLTADDRAVARSELETQLGPDWATSGTERLRELQVDQQAAINAWGQVEPPTPTEDELRRAYIQGPRASGIVCASHILVESAAEAADVLDELDGGAEFAEVAERRSTDAGSAPDGGALPCSSAGEFAASVIPEFADAALAADIGVPTGPVESTFGVHVIMLRTFDEVRDEGIDEIYSSSGVRFRRAAVDADIHVDPRFGTFDPDAGVVPIG